MDAHGPVGEAVGGVARADDQARPEDQRALPTERVPRILLRQRLAEPVRQPLHTRLDPRAIIRPDGRGNGHGDPAGVRVHRPRGDEDVALAGVLEQTGAELDPARVGGRIVDHHVPSASFQGGQVPVAVADQLLEPREEVRVGAAPVEEGDFVAARQGVLDLMGADEAGAAQDEDLEAAGGRGATGDFGRVAGGGGSRIRARQRTVSGQSGRQCPAGRRRGLEKSPPARVHGPCLRRVVARRENSRLRMLMNAFTRKMAVWVSGATASTSRCMRRNP